MGTVALFDAEFSYLPRFNPAGSQRGGASHPYQTGLQYAGGTQVADPKANFGVSDGREYRAVHARLSDGFSQNIGTLAGTAGYLDPGNRADLGDAGLRTLRRHRGLEDRFLV